MSYSELISPPPQSKAHTPKSGKGKGKGLVAKERITSGETVWKEDPFILAPEWYDNCPCIVRRKFCFHGWSFQERREDGRSALR